MLKLPQCWAQVKPVGRQHDRPRAFPRDSDSFSQQQSRCCFDHFLQPPHLPSHQSSPLRKLALLLIGLLGCFYWINDIFAYFFFSIHKTHTVCGSTNGVLLKLCQRPLNINTAEGNNNVELNCLLIAGNYYHNVPSVPEK